MEKVFFVLICMFKVLARSVYFTNKEGKLSLVAVEASIVRYVHRIFVDSG